MRFGVTGHQAHHDVTAGFDLIHDADNLPHRVKAHLLALPHPRITVGAALAIKRDIKWKWPCHIRYFQLYFLTLKDDLESHLWFACYLNYHSQLDLHFKEYLSTYFLHIKTQGIAMAENLNKTLFRNMHRKFLAKWHAGVSSILSESDAFQNG